MQGRGIRSESQDSRSPDSACSLGYDSREPSPDCVLDGEGNNNKRQNKGDAVKVVPMYLI